MVDYDIYIQRQHPNRIWSPKILQIISVSDRGSLATMLIRASRITRMVITVDTTFYEDHTVYQLKLFYDAGASATLRTTDAEKHENYVEILKGLL